MDVRSLSYLLEVSEIRNQNGRINLLCIEKVLICQQRKEYPKLMLLNLLNMLKVNYETREDEENRNDNLNNTIV